MLLVFVILLKNYSEINDRSSKYKVFKKLNVWVCFAPGGMCSFGKIY